MKIHRITQKCVICGLPHSRGIGIQTCSKDCSEEHARLIIKTTRHKYKDKYKDKSKVYHCNYNKAITQLRKNHREEFANILNKIKEKNEQTR